MRVLLCILVLLPIVWCASIDERFILDSFGGGSDGGLLQTLKDTLGSDTSEAVCESTCQSLVPGGALVASLVCPTTCKELQALAQG